MTKQFDDTALSQAMGAVRVELAIDREHSIRLLGIFYTEIAAGRQPPDEAMLFVAGGVGKYLEEGGDIVKDHWRITKPKSHETPQRVWQQMRLIGDERQPPKRRRKIRSK